MSKFRTPLFAVVAFIVVLGVMPFAGRQISHWLPGLDPAGRHDSIPCAATRPVRKLVPVSRPRSLPVSLPCERPESVPKSRPDSVPKSRPESVPESRPRSAATGGATQVRPAPTRPSNPGPAPSVKAVVADPPKPCRGVVRAGCAK